MKILYNIIKLVLLFVVINIAGRFLWPFAAYLTNQDIGILCYWVSGTVFAIGLIWLIISLIKKQSKRFPLWTIAIACSFLSCCFTTIFERYGENGHYIGEYIEYYEYEEEKWPNIHGIADRFGRKIIESKFAWILQIFSNKHGAKMFVGVEQHQIENDSVYSLSENTFDLYLYDDDGMLKKTVKVENSKYENITELIENEYGKILYDFSGNSHKITDSDTRIHKVENIEKLEENSLTEVIDDNVTKVCNDENDRYDENDKQEVEEVVVRHVHEKQQVWKERWKPCISCDPDRKGRCNNCHGQGGYYIGNIFNVCGACSGTGACPWCGGRGEIMETYSVWE